MKIKRLFILCIIAIVCILSGKDGNCLSAGSLFMKNKEYKKSILKTVCATCGFDLEPWKQENKWIDINLSHGICVDCYIDFCKDNEMRIDLELVTSERRRKDKALKYIYTCESNIPFLNLHSYSETLFGRMKNHSIGMNAMIKKVENCALSASILCEKKEPKVLIKRICCECGFDSDPWYKQMNGIIIRESHGYCVDCYERLISENNFPRKLDRIIKLREIKLKALKYLCMSSFNMVIHLLNDLYDDILLGGDPNLDGLDKIIEEIDSISIKSSMLMNSSV